MMSNEFLVDMSNLGVQLAPTAGEAHWQLGIVERMIRTVWSAAERVMKETGVDIHEAVSLSVKSQNQVERVKGYSPAQWVLGKSPTIPGHVLNENIELPLLDEAEGMAGSMFILEAPDRAAVEAFTAADPYSQAGLFGQVEIRGYRASVGSI